MEQDRRAAITFRNRAFWIALAVLLGGVSYLAGLPYFPWLNLAAFILALYALIPFHEAAHLLAAWVTGNRVLEVRYGTGPQVRSWQIAGARLVLYRYPTAAGCLVSDPRPQGRRRRAAVVAGAGPAFNLLVCLVLVPALQARQLIEGLAVPEMIFLASLMHLLAGFVHWRTGSGELPGPSDAGRVWMALRGERSGRH